MMPGFKAGAGGRLDRWALNGFAALVAAFLVLPIMVGPLLLGLRGVLYGRPYTHAWLSMLSLLYFTHGVVETWSNSAERQYAALEVICSVLLFLGSMFYARYRARELKSTSGEVRQQEGT